MTSEQKGLANSLVTGKELKSLATHRRKSINSESISKLDLASYMADGWKTLKELKTRTKVYKDKSPDAHFEDTIWCLMLDLGFHSLNRDRNLRIPYEKQGNLTQQIDVLAIDDESILVIECKSSTGVRRTSSFKNDIEAIGGRKEGINATLRKEFPNKKYKISYIFATKNYNLTEQDKDRLQAFGIHHFDEESVKYYDDLAKQLGHSARYQLEASLFHNTTIPELENKVAAIQGKMGGHTYYAFSIEPEKLLKVGYVLHRTQANIKLMPTYQRLIKKSRLTKISAFINGGGFFPNSIVCSIDSNGKKVQFEPANTQIENSVTKLGILHLPKRYRSIFIIDGQHRLYSYGNSDYAKTNSIPVVAFLDLEKGDQVQMFMDINENQKSVPKNLRITLESDLYWDSEDAEKRLKSLYSQIAISLGEDLASPLYGKVIVGENQKTSSAIITLKSIVDGLSQSTFFDAYKNSEIVRNGTLSKGSNTQTYNFFMPIATQCFSYVRQLCEEEWNRSHTSLGLLISPSGITSTLKLFSDIVDCLVLRNGYNPKSKTATDVAREMEYYLDPLADFFENLVDKDRVAIRKAYGSGGATKLYRTLQKAISDQRPEFSPPGLAEYWLDESMQFNTRAYEMIRDIELHLNSDFESKLRKAYGENWLKKIPAPVYESIVTLAAKKNYEQEPGDADCTPWDCLHLIDYRKIAIYGSNWQDIFSNDYSFSQDKGGNKDDKTKWLERLNRIRNQNAHTYSVKKEEFEFIKEVHTWLFRKK